MTPTRWQRIEKIIDSALERPDAERTQFVKQQAEGDIALEIEVLALLDQHENADGVLDQPAVLPPDPLQPGEWVGYYRVERELGRGGMGRVLLATRADDQFRKLVAIKILHAGLTDPELLQRFRNERQILASLDHPNIARVIDGGSTKDGMPYFVMDYVEGQPIDAHCREQTLSTRQILEIFRKVCLAVQYAHSRLVVHRDLKPSNILVTDDGDVKLLDFGIAKLLQPEAVQVRTLAETKDFRLMTPKYASPEQIRGETIGTATDIYSLGVILYELLTGRPPYDIKEAAMAAIEKAILSEEPQRPSTVITRPSGDTTRTITIDARKRQRELTGDLDTIVLMALRKEPLRRYQSVEQFSEDIRKHLEGLPVIAQPDRFGYRAGKFFQRNRYKVLAGAAVAASLVAGIFTTTLQKLEADRQRARAEERMFDIFELTNSFLHKFHDELREIPGADKARFMVLEETRRTLEKLEKTSNEDKRVQRRLAPAYNALATMEANPFGAVRGDPKKASAFTARAVVLLEHAYAGQELKPDDREELANMYQNHADLLQGFDPKQATVFYGKAIKVRDEWNKLDPDAALNLKGYAMIAGRRADLIMRTGGAVDDAIADYAKAVEIADRLIAKGETAVNAQGVRLTKDTNVYRMMRLSLIPWHGKLARAYQQAGQTEKALQHFAKSAEQNRKMIQEEPLNGSLAPNLAFTILNIGMIQQNKGLLTEAAKEFRESAALLEGKQDARNSLLSANLAGAYQQLAEVLLDMGKPGEALVEARKAFALQEGLTKSGNPEHEVAFATAHVQIGKILARTQDKSGAAASLGRAQTMLEGLQGKVRTSSREVQLTEALVELGRVQAATGNRAAARKSLETAVATLEPLAGAAKGNVTMQYRLARALGELASFRQIEGASKEAAALAARAVGIVDSLIERDGKNKNYLELAAKVRAGLAEAQAGMGDVPAALATARKAAEWRGSLGSPEVSVRYLKTMGEVYRIYGSLLEKAGRGAEADRAYGNGMAVMEGARSSGLLYHDAMQVYQQLSQAKRRTA